MRPGRTESNYSQNSDGYSRMIPRDSACASQPHTCQVARRQQQQHHYHQQHCANNARTCQHRRHYHGSLSDLSCATPAVQSFSLPVMEVESADPGNDPLRSIPKSPVVVLMIGMAGSGKSTFMHRMVVRLQSKQKKVYTVNLDPAVRNLAYPVNIDIRDTVNYKEVMKHFGLGPNGGIMTALNLFATKFDQVLSILGRRAESLDYVLIDTPGQIEVFNWSASGQIVCDALAVSYPTLVCYVVDTARCVKPVTFMSNMLYACSILYKTKLPFIIAFNKRLGGM